MARTPKSQKPTEEGWEDDTYSYHGRKVEVRKHGDHAHYRLFIDGEEIDMEQRERGVISHAMMYREFGTPYELAEALIREWGTSKITSTPHPHDPEHSDHNNHPH